MCELNVPIGNGRVLRHALAPGRPNVLVEIRHDLIRGADGQIAWADRLAPILEAALADADL